MRNPRSEFNRPNYMLRVRFALVAVLCVALGACGKASGGPTPGPSPSPTGPPLALVELKLRVIEALPGPIDWCDPDIFPVGRGTELENARKALPGMKRDRATYDAILDHEGIPHDAELTDQQLVTVYRDYKLVAHETPVELTRDGDVYRFELVVANTDSGYDDQVIGHVTTDGTVTIDQTVAGGGSAGSFEPNCPICLARNTRIATPFGPVRIQDIRVGMTVWSTDLAGHRIRAVVSEIGHTPVPVTHQVVRLVLADGRRVLVSPGHPTADGRAVGELRVGQPFDGSRVVTARLVTYAGGFTFDLLPSGPTGTYFANGVLLGSTLASNR